MPVQPPKPNPRERAWRVLRRWAKNETEFADSLIHRAENGLSNADRALLHAIVLGVLRHLRYLDHKLTELRDGRSLQNDARWLILTGLCQLFVLRLPAYAVVNETVKLAPANWRGLVNGILRESLRRAKSRPHEDESLPLGVRYSMPDWLVQRWLNRFGDEECRSLLHRLGQPSPICLRINELNPPPSIPSSWAPVPDAPGWFSLTEGGLPANELQGGHIYIADPSTRYCVELLDPRPGEILLDSCAAPGGKSCAILSAVRAHCHLVATDNAESRLIMLRRNLQNAAPMADTRVLFCDWTQKCPEKFLGAFDGVLADVPCSNSGVLQRRVDVRWRLSPQELLKLTKAQFVIASNAMCAVKPGGRFVYSTCSIEPEENDELVRRLLETHPGWSMEREILVLPHKVHADGAYAALLRAPSSPSS